MIHKSSILTDVEITYYVENPFRFRMPSREHEVINRPNEMTVALEHATYLANPDRNIYCEADTIRLREVEAYRYKVCRWNFINKTLQNRLSLSPDECLDKSYIELEKERDTIWNEVKWLFDDVRFIHLSEDKATNYYAWLIEHNFIISTTKEDFLYVFCMSKDYKLQHKIIWDESVQLLRELIEDLKLKGYINLPSKAEIERRIPKFFADKNGNDKILAKPKKTNTKPSRMLAKFLATL